MKYSKDCRTINTLYVLSLCFLLLFGGCAEQEEEAEIPEHIVELENLKILEPEAESVDSLELVKDQEYGSTEEIIIGGISDFEVDGKGRVYIVEGNVGSGVIYVYEPDGSYLTTIGQYGRGPGDLLNTIEMQIWNKKLYVFNGVNSGTQISVFSTEDFSFVEMIRLSRGDLKYDEELARLFRGNEMYVLEDRFLMNFTGGVRIYGAENFGKSDESQGIPYYHRSMDGELVSGKVFERRRMEHFYPEGADEEAIFHSQPFSRKSILAVSKDGTIYTAWTEDFLIKVLNREGEYQQAFYYPYEKSNLTSYIREYGGLYANRVSNQMEEDTWPALYSMFVDNKNRLWVATISDSENHLGGIVLNSKGDVLGKFAWPGKRTEHMGVKDRKIVRNGYFYTRTADEETGLSTLERYQINTVEGEPFE